MNIGTHAALGLAACLAVAAGSRITAVPRAIVRPTTLPAFVESVRERIVALRPDPCRALDEPFPPPVDLDRPGPESTPFRMRYRRLRSCTGERPTAQSNALVSYAWWTTAGQPWSRATRWFPIAGLPDGMRDGLMRMRVGDRARVWFGEGSFGFGGTETPAEHAFDDPTKVMVVDVELVAIRN